jgi:hypothetical protein
MKKLNLEYLKKEMWLELCEGDNSIEMSDSYKELVSDIGDEEVDGIEFIVNFYKILDRFISNGLIEFEGGDSDMLSNMFDDCGISLDEFNNCFDEYSLS